MKELVFGLAGVFPSLVIGMGVESLITVRWLRRQLDWLSASMAVVASQGLAWFLAGQSPIDPAELPPA